MLKARFLICAIATCLFSITVKADQSLISLFPMEHYSQSINQWINPTDTGYDRPLLSTDMQHGRLEEFYNHYAGALSPWSPEYVNAILAEAPPNDLTTVEEEILTEFSNAGKTGDDITYGENFRPYPVAWNEAIRNQIDLSLLTSLTYDASHRAIAITNINARALPTNDVNFFNPQLPGQGYPFDNLQMSSIWMGSPLYVLMQTVDHAWSLVITSSFIAWVETKDIAYTNDLFVRQWQQASRDHLVAITKTKTAVLDQHAYVGTVFPGHVKSSSIKIMVPIMSVHHEAIIRYTHLSTSDAALMPLSATPHHFAELINTLIGRPYGWGNLYFYNDCSAELKSLFTPFAIWLPRHSSDQVTAGKLVDLSQEPALQRLEYLMMNGDRLMTIIYIGGHVILYVGTLELDGQPVAMTYQDIWGLSPNPPVRRSVMGGAVFLPMLLQYPEDTSLTSLADKKYFQMSYLDQMPTNLRAQRLGIRQLMLP